MHACVNEFFVQMLRVLHPTRDRQLGDGVSRRHANRERVRFLCEQSGHVIRCTVVFINSSFTGHLVHRVAADEDVCGFITHPQFTLAPMSLFPWTY